MKHFSTHPALLIAAVFGTAVFIACSSARPKEEEKPVKDTLTMKTDTILFDHLLVDNKKDPACGMPVSAGISDTAHYKNHVLGFCSKECKESFAKNPDALIAAAELTHK
ncbi:YHS domain-containing protein [Sediminibacterium soli]|uniref:YHS domain-containing protein n=1 Tax=Sediminibacterium soli TaxID=2698829 RepID=UPI00137AC430|nr:YHS domain-containing protein [Sediminibacterium soli]NCI47658.1 YHS domain-containing protein [Sediminibacterium soli]